MKLIYKIIKWVVGAILLTVIFGLAVKNMQDVALRFFGEHEVHSPLALLLFEFFLGGVVFGVLGMSYVALSHFLEVSKLKKTLAEMNAENEAQKLARTQQPPIDAIVSK